MKLKSKIQNPKFLGLIIVCLLLALPVAYTIGQTPDYIWSPDSMVESYSYLVWTDGVTVYAVNGLTRVVDFSGTDASTVIQAAWNNMVNGGRIHIKGKLTLSTALILKLTKYTTALELIGEGETESILEWEGTGYALTISTDDTLVGYYDLLLQGFTIEGISKIADRNGLKIEKVGRNAYVKDLLIENMDIGLYIHNTNLVFVDGIKIIGTNTGIITEGGTTSSAIMMSIEHFKITDAADYGIWLKTNTGSNGIKIKMGAIEKCGIGIYNNEGIWNIGIEDIYFESSTNYDIDIEGNSWLNQAFGVNINRNYFNSYTAYAIKLNYVSYALIENCHSHNHIIAFIQVNPNHGHPVYLLNNRIEDPLVMSPSRLAENSGIAYFAGNSSTTFYHDLAGTPTYVSCGFNSTAYVSWSWTATSTKITIIVTTLGNYKASWYAEYVP